MDPNKNLDAALEHARLIVAVSEDPDDHPEANNVCVDDTSLSLARTLLDLNEYITKGGFLPEAWRGGDFERIEPLDEGMTLNVKLTSEGVIVDRVDAVGDVQATWALTYGELDERLY